MREARGPRHLFSTRGPLPQRRRGSSGDVASPGGARSSPWCRLGCDTWGGGQTSFGPSVLCWVHKFTFHSLCVLPNYSLVCYPCPELLVSDCPFLCQKINIYVQYSLMFIPYVPYVLQRQILLQQRLINESRSKRQKMAERSSSGATDADSVALLRTGVDSSDPCKFVLQNEYFLDGARVMGIDASSQIILASGRAPGLGAEHVLTKISMFARQEMKIQLPPNTKAVRDICILPGGLAVFASLGRKLSLFSMTTNNVVLQYDLPAPGWSCSGVVTNSNHIYAGLQNGMLLVFDTRQTVAPLHSLMGLSSHPVHTIHSVVDDSGSRKVISASSIGPCIWDVDDSENRPNLLTEMQNQGVCISLACASPSSDFLVASFRPKVELSGDGTASQVDISQSPLPSGSGKLGCHALMRRTNNTSFSKDQICSGNVNELRMSKSAIIPCSGSNQHLFAYGDESLFGVRTWRLPSFQTYTDLRPHRQPILDLRLAESSTGERYLGCLSQEKLQVFKIR